MSDPIDNRDAAIKFKAVKQQTDNARIADSRFTEAGVTALANEIEGTGYLAPGDIGLGDDQNWSDLKNMLIIAARIADGIS